MDEKKQIEEMVKIMNNTCNVYDEQGNHIKNKCYECDCWSDDNHCCCSYNSKEATALYDAGYRKASDVAREIFEEIESIVNERTAFDGYIYSLLIKRDFAKLKKKYESEKDDG